MKKLGFFLFACLTFTALIFFYRKMDIQNLNYQEDEKTTTIKEDDIEEGKGTQIIRLFFCSSEINGLSEERHEVELCHDRIEFIKLIMNELIHGSNTGLTRTIPQTASLIDAFMDSKGNLYLNFNSNLIEDQIGGTQGEFLTISSIANTLKANIPEIISFEILIEGKQEKSLGHLTIFKKFYVDDFNE